MSGGPRASVIDVTSARRTLLTVLVLGALAAVVGGDVESHLSPAAGFRDPSAESTLADAALEDRFDAGPSNLLLVVTPDDLSGLDPSDPAGGELVQRLAAVDGVTDIVSLWTTGLNPALDSNSGDSTLVLARLVGDEDEIDDTYVRVTETLEGVPIDGLTIEFAGEAASNHAAVEQSAADLERAELLAAPLVLVILLFVFRSVVAAALPLAIGLLSILGTLAILRIGTWFGPMSIFSLNLTTALGFGLAVDYSLLFVSRYRAEVASGNADPIPATKSTAGRAIAFSALTTSASIAVLAVFPLGFLRSMAVAGPAVVALSGVLSLVVLPAALRLLGPNLERWTVPGREFRSSSPRWERVGRGVKRRPLGVAVVSFVGLLLLGTPFLDAEWGLSDDRILATESEVRQAFDTIRSDYDGAEFGSITVFVPSRLELADDALEDLVRFASELDHVGRVDSVFGTTVAGEVVRPADAGDLERFAAEDSAWFSIVLDTEPVSDEGRGVVEALRSTGEPIQVGGLTARHMDTTSALTSRIGTALVLVGAVSFVLLAALSRSVLIPLKALVLNALSLSATLGAIVFVFQKGNLAGLLDITATGTVDLSIVAMITLVAFGLSMDYEVFLVSRLREEYEATGDNDAAVVAALSSTATIITASAALIAIVFAAFIVADIALVKMSGIGIALAVVVDALIVRSTLAPALLFLAKDANWWWPFGQRPQQPAIDLRTSEAVSDLVAAEEPTTHETETSHA